MIDHSHGVVIAGPGSVGTELLAGGVEDFVIFDREVISSVFDDETETWQVSKAMPCSKGQSLLDFGCSTT